MKPKKTRTWIALLLCAALIVPGLPLSASADADTTYYVWSTLGENMTDIHGGKGILRQDSGKFFYLYVNKSNQMDLLVAESETGPWKSLGSPGIFENLYNLAVYEGIPLSSTGMSNTLGKRRSNISMFMQTNGFRSASPDFPPMK